MGSASSSAARRAAGSGPIFLKARRPAGEARPRGAFGPRAPDVSGQHRFTGRRSPVGRDELRPVRSGETEPDRHRVRLAPRLRAGLCFGVIEASTRRRPPPGRPRPRHLRSP
jgi:hypothetical protein